MSEQDILTDDELDAVLHATLDGAPEGVVEPDMVRIVDWAMDLKISEAILELVRRREVFLEWSEDQEDVILRKRFPND